MLIHYLQAGNESLLRQFTEDCDGVYGTLEQAITELTIPRIKVTKSMPSFKGFLQLGDAEKYETAFRIPVERYFRTYIAKPPSASSFVLRSGKEQDEEAEAAATQTPVDSQALTAVRTSRTYQIKDENAPGGKVDVERDDLAKGYEYGRTAVHISQTDENITILETFAGLELIGFIHKEKVYSQQIGPLLRLIASYSTIGIFICRTQTSSFHSEQMIKLLSRCLPSYMPSLNLKATPSLG